MDSIILSISTCLISFVWISGVSTAAKLSYLGYSSITVMSDDLDVTTDEISGLTWFENTIDDSSNDGNVFYAISDNLVDDKGFIKLSLDCASSDCTTFEMDQLLGTVMGDGPEGSGSNTDSESIAVLGLPFNSGYYDDGTMNTPTNELTDGLYGYFVIASEGHRNFDTLDHIMLYQFDGTYIKELSIPDLFAMEDDSGTQNNGGFEALDISSNYEYLVYANERVLLQDNCDDCYRVVVASFNSFGDESGSVTSASDVEVTTEYILYYQSDGSDWVITDLVLLDPFKFAGIMNITMPAVILEVDRTAFPTDVRIYLIDLDITINDNVEDCFALFTDNSENSGECNDITPVTKTKILDFNDEIPSDITSTFTALNFEAIAIYTNISQLEMMQEINMTNDNSDDCETNSDYLVMVNDNGNVANTFFVLFELDYCDSLSTMDNTGDTGDTGDSGDSSSSDTGDTDTSGNARKYMYDCYSWYWLWSVVLIASAIIAGF